MIFIYGVKGYKDIVRLRSGWSGTNAINSKGEKILLEDYDVVQLYNTQTGYKYGFKVSSLKYLRDPVWLAGVVVTKGQFWLVQHCIIKADTYNGWRDFFFGEDGKDYVLAYKCCIKNEFDGNYVKYRLMENWVES